METPDRKHVQPSREPARPERPRYEPPRVVKKRSVSRVTLLTGHTPDAGGTPSTAFSQG